MSMSGKKVEEKDGVGMDEIGELKERVRETQMRMKECTDNYEQ